MVQRRAKAPSKTAEHANRDDRVPMSAIRRFAREVAKQFHPDKIILFGSQAYGTPDADSDVDILVIMPTRNRRESTVRIRLAIDVTFPMDLLVRTPAYVQPDWNTETHF